MEKVILCFTRYLKKQVQMLICALLLCPISLSSYAETLNLATVEWQPFYGNDLPESGFFTALAREAFKRAGYDIKVHFQPWKRALEATKKGKFDGMLGVYYSEERVEYLSFSAPVFENRDVFISLADGLKNYALLDDLKAHRIASLRAAAYTDQLKALEFTVVETDTELQSLRMLAKERVDLVLTSEMHFKYLLNKHDDLQLADNNFHILEKPYKTFKLYCPISKKHPNHELIVYGFNTALAQMKQDGTYQEILRRFGF